jgi:cellulose synthase/poly-beta-1,6-N-acetylglucosamine synthase-like glycosyltransferase
MAPLGYFLIAWLILLAIYAIFVLLTLIQMLRHGLPSPFTYVSTFIFIAVIAAVVLGSGMYFLGVDWNQTVNFLPSGIDFFFTGGESSGGEAALDIPL